MTPERIALIRERLDANPQCIGLLLRVGPDKLRMCLSVADLRELLAHYEAAVLAAEQP